MQIATTHRNTDFDALASVVCTTLLYPDVVPVLPKAKNQNVKAFLSIHKDIFPIKNPKDINLEEVTSMIVVDVNQWDRLEGMKKLKEKNDLEVILWDHHDCKGDIVSEQKHLDTTGANITLMVEALKTNKITPSSIEATLFLAGLYEDTGNLTFSSTTARDAYAAAFLLEAGADLKILKTFLSQTYGEKQKNVLFQLLKSAQRKKIKGYNVCFGQLELNGHVSSLSIVVQMFRQIVNVDAAFCIFTSIDNNFTIVIGRSDADGINIGMIMSKLGGGGHPGAGSAKLKSANTQAVESMLTDLLTGNQQSSVQISDLMSFPVITITVDTPMKTALSILDRENKKGLLVTENDQLAGVISRRDFSRIKKKSGFKAPVKAFMSVGVKTISPGKSPLQAARMMVKHDIGRLPVVENGKIIGIISRADAMTYFYDLLPD